MTRRVAVLFALFAVGCIFEPPSAVPNGHWSGQDINLIVAPDQSELEIPCKRGTILGPIHLDADRHFAVPVTLTRCGNGCTQSDAQVEGRLVGLKLHLTVYDQGSSPQSFQLVRRPAPPLPLCP